MKLSSKLRKSIGTAPKISWHSVAFPLVLLLLCVSCKKSLPDTKTTTTDTSKTFTLSIPSNIYVAGLDSIGNVYFNNNKETLLSSPVGYVPLGAASIFVSGSNVYAAGTEEKASAMFQSAILWTNGTPEILPVNNGNISVAASVFCSGGGTYVAGLEGPPDFSSSMVDLWINGNVTHITDGTVGSGANSVFVSGSDVYLAGFSTNPANGKSIAAYWKDGTEVNLTDGSYDAYVHSIYVTGSDIYAAGFIQNDVSSQSGSVPTIAVYWKNGVITQLSDGSSNAMAYSITGSGSDVYVVGNEDQGSNRIAMYWKNGIADQLSLNDRTGSTQASAQSIFLSGSDVYVCGYEGNGGANTKTYVTYWKNGVSAQLSKSYAYPNDITGYSIFAAN